MKNLFNSPFEYWEKIGYVGYNNYTDLHLKVKKNILLKEWSNLNKKSFIENNILFSQYIQELNLEIKKNNSTTNFIYSKNKIKNTKKFKFFCIFNSLIYLFKKTYLIQSNYIKILKFLSNWKKKKYKSIFYLFQYKKNISLLKKYFKLINDIYNLYFKILFFYLKKFIIVIKKKFYRYLKFFFQYSFLLKKKEPLFKLVKHLIKNIYLLYKNPFFLKQYQKILTINKETSLYNNSLSKDYFGSNVNYPETNLFHNVPQTHNKKKKIFKLFICNFFNVSINKIKYFVYKYNFVKWEDLFFFLHNNLNNYLNYLKLDHKFIKSLSLNGKSIALSKNVDISLRSGDIIEINTYNKQVISNWLNHKLILLFLLSNRNNTESVINLYKSIILITSNYLNRK